MYVDMVKLNTPSKDKRRMISECRNPASAYGHSWAWSLPQRYCGLGTWMAAGCPVDTRLSWWEGCCQSCHLGTTSLPNAAPVVLNDGMGRYAAEVCESHNYMNKFISIFRNIKKWSNIATTGFGGCEKRLSRVEKKFALFPRLLAKTTSMRSTISP